MVSSDQGSADFESRGRKMRLKLLLATIGLLLAGAVALPNVPTVQAQQITGTPGSPAATTTIEGEQLPAPPAKFGGKIERNAAAVEALLAGARRAAQGRAERAADHDRRRRLRRARAPSAA